MGRALPGSGVWALREPRVSGLGCVLTGRHRADLGSSPGHSCACSLTCGLHRAKLVTKETETQVN